MKVTSRRIRHLDMFGYDHFFAVLMETQKHSFGFKLHDWSERDFKCFGLRIMFWNWHWCIRFTF